MGTHRIYIDVVADADDALDYFGLIWSAALLEADAHIVITDIGMTPVGEPQHLHPVSNQGEGVVPRG